MQALCDHTIDSSFCLLNLIVFIGIVVCTAELVLARTSERFIGHVPLCIGSCPRLV